MSIILAAAALTCVWAALDLLAGGLRSHEERPNAPVCSGRVTP